MDAIDRVVAQWDKERPDLNTLPMAMIGRLSRLYKHLEMAIADVHKRYGLKLGEFDVLATLRRAGKPFELTPSELIASMMLTSGAMTNRLDKLENKGLITRCHSTADRRSVSVALTASGLQLIDEIIEEHVKAQQKLVKNLSLDEQQMINQSLKVWLGHFE
ncbi:MarR family transcriptional regulator [Vibrio aestuarianus]|uniref:MarR family transcriptional regulator n=1 Tax=Vibrio aestuarianus TaxID=28171 RepID=A0A9X4ET91_9VIBR|nr:MarR family transcriptional regulator [Vibrio aestuarianus]MDE1209717.1 MarR family transcriptional regulator [Vibrio aestuarianus]MDE1221929.1 MarR family transcriptional regulator [Vibrio aestuarianus]MDE1224349.1 MarR family transcriptional regulator [Vibrio aestuarianus]MDE1241161.1 MarR family transcriptional regulator [Vibrio aestuarianus]MDE1251440.1 MarR family transcriptional regulator [Vibrio aestuarianus]